MTTRPPSPLAEWADDGPADPFAMGTLIAPLLEEIQALRSTLAGMGMAMAKFETFQGASGVAEVAERLDGLRSRLGEWTGELKETAAARERRDAIRPLLVGVDALIRARNHLAGREGAAEVLGGIEEVISLFDQLLLPAGFTPLEPAAGEPFDPESQIAIGQATGPSGAVVATLQRGWVCAGRVVRPAEVTVGNGEQV